MRGNEEVEPSSIGGGPLLAADGSGTLEISRAGELIASVPVEPFADDVPAGWVLRREAVATSDLTIDVS
ncbi:hypothetical protein ACFQ3F_03515 [Nocardioides ginsengisoli]|uniref:Uncharacterized protein n=1 Tax=Nocardioides ginsengisoli TaxID=363868 RepID=A0ABW3VXD8_9ACTN